MSVPLATFLAEGELAELVASLCAVKLRYLT